MDIALFGFSCASNFLRMCNRTVGVAVKNLCRWLFTEQGDILHQLPGGQKAFQSIFFHTVCLQIRQIIELFQNFSDLEQSSFLEGSNTLIPSAAHGQI